MLRLRSLKSLQEVAISGSGIILSAVFGLILTKLIALHKGPAGIGEFGTYRQFIQVMAAILSCGNGYAIIEGYPRAEDKNQFLRQVQNYIAGGVIIASGLVALFATPLSYGLFNSDEYESLFLFSPAIFVCIGGYSFFRYVAAGRHQGGLASALQALPFFAMVVAYFIKPELFVIFGFGYGAAALVAFFLFKPKSTLGFHWPPQRSLTFERTAIATLISAALSFTALLVVKAICTRYLGLEQTGLFEANLNLLNYVTLIFLSALGLYYLPSLSKEPTNSELIQKTFKQNVIYASIAIGILIVAQTTLTHLFFRNDFDSDFLSFGMMAMGEYAKCTNWFFIFSMIALSHKRQYLKVEIVTNILFVIVAFVVIPRLLTLQSAAAAYLVFNAVYLGWNCIWNHRVRLVPPKTLYGCLALGAGIIVAIILVRSFFGIH